MSRLRIEFHGAETVVPLGEADTTVGSSNRCTINIPDPALADVHFRIRRKGDSFRLKDDGSGSGTLVNGKAVFATALEHGDVIEAGGLRCVFLARTEPAKKRRRAPPPPPPPSLTTEQPKVPTSRRAPRGRSSGQRNQLLAIAILVVAAVAVVALVLRGGSGEEAAQELYGRVQTHLESASLAPASAGEQLEEARKLLKRILDEHPATAVAGTATVTLGETESALAGLAGLEEERRRIQAGLDEEGEQGAFERLARLRKGAHPAIVAGVESLREDLKLARLQRLERRFADAEERAGKLRTERRFADAMRVWRELEIGDYFLRKRVDAAMRGLEKRISEEYHGLLRLAGRNDDLDVRIDLLEASRPVFVGTRQADDLEVRISALRARRARPVVLDTPKPDRKPDTTEPAPDEPPEDLGPYRDPPKVAEMVAARRYAAASSLLHSISRHPEAKVRIEELTLLANLMADLVAAVQAAPDEFTRIPLPDGQGRGTALDADANTVTVDALQEEVTVGWGEIESKAFVKIFRQAGFHKPQRLAAAIFFDEEGLAAEARRAYVAYYKTEQAPTTFNRILARRRGIKPPPGGFVAFRNAIITPAERDRVLLTERIAKLGRDGRSSNARRRRSAWEELEGIGEQAAETLALCLQERRRTAAAELKSSRAFTPARFVARFGKELQERRRAALAFIRNEKLYPYPNKSEPAQRRAEKLVDSVRELYETPVDELLEASEEAQALDAEIRELDTRMARIDPLAEPLHDAIVDDIVKVLDMRRIAVDERDRKRIGYNLSVERYNRELKSTSADEEERANTKAVNEYRWMMGLHSVKIDERLVRAARKHSIEMLQLNYFAHDSPTKHLRNPGMRAKRDGYGGGVSENIARGAPTGQAAFEQWFGSSGHHRNMLNGGHTEMGCGAARRHWWTQLFGRMSGRNLGEPNVPEDPDPPGTSGNGLPAPSDPAAN